LVEAIRVARDSVLEDVPAQSRDVLERVLSERFTEPPAVIRDGQTRVRTSILMGVQSQLAPLTDPTITPSGKSFLDEIGVDSARLRDRLANALLRSIEQVGSASPALSPLIIQLNADAITERVDAVLDKLTDRERTAFPGRDTSLGSRTWRMPPAGTSGFTRLSPEAVTRLADALLATPSVVDPDGWRTIRSMLPLKLQNAMPHSRYPRLQVLDAIHSTANHDYGLSYLVRGIRLVEGDSAAMEALDQVILSLDDEQDPRDPIGHHDA
jgi:hypothetical protein